MNHYYWKWNIFSHAKFSIVHFKFSCSLFRLSLKKHRRAVLDFCVLWHLPVDLAKCPVVAPFHVLLGGRPCGYTVRLLTWSWCHRMGECEADIGHSEGDDWLLPLSTAIPLTLVGPLSNIPHSSPSPHTYSPLQRTWESPDMEAHLNCKLISFQTFVDQKTHH